ncbi:MAG TPA: SDR family NAD(P)-dependent oxidoreductase [Candidatus Angelobacter sp.]|nr:SDR family NAD(P)-dependent oxidoreductase [Candidatus Angelobacter sp.]
MSIQLSVNNQVALITGGSRGIGAAAVRMFVAAGAKVLFNYQLARKAAEQLVRECGETNCATMQMDLHSAASGGKLVEAAVARFGSLDTVVANHGVWPAGDAPIDEMSEEQWRSTMAVNLDAVFGLVKYAVAQMKVQAKKQRPGGSIVLVSSTAGQRGEAFHCDYAASKGALISMVKGLSTELASEQIRVNCVAPGWVATEMSAPALNDPKAREKIFKSIPLGRVATPEEIAAPILFLCSEHAGFITGEVFNVNGGAVLVG